MRAFAHQGLALLAALAILTGCTGPAQQALLISDVRPAGAHLTQSQVIGIAKHTAESAGVHLADFQEPVARYECIAKDKTWTVFFIGKAPIPGNHFSIWIDDRTQKEQLLGGE